MTKIFMTEQYEICEGHVHETEAGLGHFMVVLTLYLFCIFMMSFEQKCIYQLFKEGWICYAIKF